MIDSQTLAKRLGVVVGPRPAGLGGPRFDAREQRGLVDLDLDNVIRPQPRASSIAARPSACATVRGKPSRMTPLAQSGLSMRSAIMPRMMSSETSSPRSMISFACMPSSVPASMAARSMSPVDSWTMPRLSTRRLACVPLPARGLRTE